MIFLILNKETVEISKNCTNLAAYLVDKLFSTLRKSIKDRLGKQGGIVSKLKHYDPQMVLLKNIQAINKVVIQYGILIESSASYSAFDSLLKLQKKFL